MGLRELATMVALIIAPVLGVLGALKLYQRGTGSARVGSALLSVASIVLAAWWWPQVYVTQYRTADVPKVTGVDPRSATLTLQNAGFHKVHVIPDTRPADVGMKRVAPGSGKCRVDAQTPLPREQLDRAKSVTLRLGCPEVTLRPPTKPRLYAGNFLCAGQRCTLFTTRGGIQTTRGPLRLDLIGLPIPDGGKDPMMRPFYAALYATNGRLIYRTPEPVIGAYDAATPTNPGRGVTADGVGRIFIPFLVGDHSGRLLILDPNGRTVQDFGSFSGTGFLSDSPGATGRDIDGDGLNEMVLPTNTYKPNYAEGTPYERYYGYQDGRWVLLGCSSPDAPYDAQPRIAPGETHCVP